MNKTKIEWCDYTFNPVTGCKHGCKYCYASKIAIRFTGHFNPTFHPKRLKDKMPKKPSKIFVCSMADLFGDWVPSDWIEQILMRVVCQNPQHTFMFLTKNPKRYSEYGFPSNTMLGVTINTKNDLERMEILTKQKRQDSLFVSIEPLLDDFTGVDFSGVDLIIVGAMTGAGAIKPKREWIESIKHRNIFYKDNLGG